MGSGARLGRPSGSGQRGRRGADGDRGLALLVDAAAYPPRVGAIHRVVADLNPESAAMLAASGFKVRELPGGAAELEAALGELAAAGERGGALLLTGGERAYLPADRPGPGAGRGVHSRRPACRCGGGGFPPPCCGTCCGPALGDRR